MKTNKVMDFIFLSAQPLASVILYSDKFLEFKCYSINGHDLNVDKNDVTSLQECKSKNVTERMISPLVFTDSGFSDYLLYVFGYQFIILRKMPLMDITLKISFDNGELISLINISSNKEIIYAVDNNSTQIYLIKNKEKKMPPSPISFIKLNKE